MAIQDSYKKMLLDTFGESIAEEVIKSYDDEPIRGLRKNKKYNYDLPFKGTVSSINPDMFIPDNYAQSVTHPYHHAGLYYIQDPTASVPAATMNVQEGDIVLDMCAAPGGKSTQILNNLGDRGILIANEMDRGRANKLKGNLERWGYDNVILTQEDGNKLQKYFPNTFDKVMLDAPCSGEGLYRKYQEHADSYQENTYKKFVEIQSSLLESAYHVTKPNGFITYSTCTLNYHENEGVIQHFLERHPECILVDIKWPTKYIGLGSIGPRLVRFFPSIQGEGHFIACLQVVKEGTSNLLNFESTKRKTILLEGIEVSGYFKEINNHLFYHSHPIFLSSKCKILMDGLDLGEYKKNRFDFNPSLVYNYSVSDKFPKIELNTTEMYEYLYGLGIPKENKGWGIVTFDGYNIGLVKGTGTNLNNKYPKHLRNKFSKY